MHVLAGAALAGALVLAGCTSEAPSTDEPHPPSGTSPVASPSMPPRSHVSRRVVVPPAVQTMPRTWREVFAVSYGPGREQLGTSRGGEGGLAEYGPESGAPAPDGTWWFLDVAKLRLAHYGSSGAFLEAVRVPRRLLVAGRYFQWQLPHVLADGTLVAFRLTGGGGGMLRLRDGALDEVPLSAMFTPTYDDGRLLYGGVVGGSQSTVLDPETGVVASVPSYRLPSGGAFTLMDDFDAGVLRVRTATASVRLTAVTSSGAIAHVGVQVRAGADDSLHLFLVGYGDDTSAQLVGYTRISRTGEVATPEAALNPFSEADRGSSAQLAIVPGETTPMLVLVLTDGVHVYRHTT